MHQLTKFISILGATLLLAACGSSSTTSTSSSASPQTGASPTSGGGSELVKTSTNSALGTTVLVDTRGLTLYHLSGEQHGNWICTSSACARAWHPLTTRAGAAPSGSVGSLGTTKRPDGTFQVTYKGTPLYTFVGDKKAGESKGQGIQDVGVWSAVTAAAGTRTTPAAPAPAPAPPAPTPAPSSGGSSYGY
ncbi:MAG: hypothetical protein M3065_13240 [Actinomycetota bacterium]|nr:hypothetical protein [Actinomycetota bacterium]